MKLNGGEIAIKLIASTENQSPHLESNLYKNRVLRDLNGVLKGNETNLAKHFGAILKWTSANDNISSCYLFWALEYVPGEDLADLGYYLKESGTEVSSGEIKIDTIKYFILYQITIGLKELHDLGFGHFGLKPENVMIGVTGDVIKCF